MGVFHVFRSVLMVPNRATHHKYYGMYGMLRRLIMTEKYDLCLLKFKLMIRIRNRIYDRKKPLFGWRPNLARLFLSTRENLFTIGKWEIIWRHSMTLQKRFSPWKILKIQALPDSKRIFLCMSEFTNFY